MFRCDRMRVLPDTRFDIENRATESVVRRANERFAASFASSLLIEKRSRRLAVVRNRRRRRSIDEQRRSRKIGRRPPRCGARARVLRRGSVKLACLGIWAAVALSSLSARAEDEPLRLDFQANTGCPDRSTFVAEVRAPDEIVLRKKSLVDASQAYFWTDEWQRGEREAQDDIRRRRVKRFRSAKALISDLKR